MDLKKISQKELSRRAGGTNTNLVRDIMSGKTKKPHQKTLQNLADEMSLSFEELMDETLPLPTFDKPSQLGIHDTVELKLVVPSPGFDDKIFIETGDTAFRISRGFLKQYNVAARDLRVIRLLSGPSDQLPISGDIVCFDVSETDTKMGNEADLYLVTPKGTKAIECKPSSDIKRDEIHGRVIFVMIDQFGIHIDRLK